MVELTVLEKYKGCSENKADCLDSLNDHLLSGKGFQKPLSKLFAGNLLGHIRFIKFSLRTCDESVSERRYTNIVILKNTKQAPSRINGQ